MIPYVFSLQIGHLLPDLLRRLEIVTTGLEIEPGLSTICSQFLNVMPFCIVKLIERQLIDYLQREGHGADLIINLDTTFQMLLVSLVHGALGLTDILGAVLEGIQIDQAEAIRLDIGKRIYGGHIIIFRIHKTASMRDTQLNTLLPEDDELSVTAMIPRVLVDEIIIKIVRLGESLSIFFSTFCVIWHGDQDNIAIFGLHGGLMIHHPIHGVETDIRNGYHSDYVVIPNESIIMIDKLFIGVHDIRIEIRSLLPIEYPRYILAAVLCIYPFELDSDKISRFQSHEPALIGYLHNKGIAASGHDSVEKHIVRDI